MDSAALTFLCAFVYATIFSRLNSSIKTLARKTNKTKLLEIKSIWDRDNKKRKTPSSCSPPSVATGNNGGVSSLMKVIQHVIVPQSSDVDRMIAVTLHESSHNEFPCWDISNNDEITGILPSKCVQICFFLGAVRDMHKNENRILRQCCDQNQIPLLRIRFGPVSEFTSKILSVLSYHTSNHPRLPLGCERIIARNQHPKIDATAESIMATHPTILQFLCHVPIAAHAVTTSLSHRHRIMWCMVRCTVTCLWRSRLAGAKNHHDETASANHPPPPINRLSFIFNDGIVLTLDQNDLVVDMASNHQAAPSEYQILATIRKKLDAKQTQINDTLLTDRLIPSALHQSIFYDTNQNHMYTPSICIDFLVAKDTSEHDFYFYKSMDHRNTSNRKARLTSESVSQVIAICISIRSDSESTLRSIQHEIHQAITDACEVNATKEKFIRISGHRIINMDDCVDEEGATITMIQHLTYQGRLFNLCCQIAAHDLQKVST